MDRTAFHRRGRRGVTLLEVLISIFVLSIGLLGVAALIPVGRFAIVQTGIADRSAACGRAAQSEVQIRNMLNPYSWRYIDSSATPILQPVVNNVFDPGESFAIDPLFMAANNYGSGVGSFPYFQSLPTQPVWTIRRVTLAKVTGVNAATHLAFFNRIFTWHDDLLFHHPEDPTWRPLQLQTFRDSSFFGTARERAVADNDSQNEWGWVSRAAMDQAEESYSWLATVSPAVAEANLEVDNRRLYEVSVVVFYKRDFAYNPGDPVPSERTAGVRFLGGGDVVLTVPGTVENALRLEVEKDQWLMLCGQAQVPDERPTAPSNPRNVLVPRWYRVVAVDEEPQLVDSQKPPGADNPWIRFVTLAGPDWNPHWNGTVDLDGDGNADTVDWSGTGAVPVQAVACLFTRAVGVYSTTVEMGP